MFNSSVSTCNCDQGSGKVCKCLGLRNVFVLFGARSLVAEPREGGFGGAEGGGLNCLTRCYNLQVNTEYTSLQTTVATTNYK